LPALDHLLVPGDGPSGPESYAQPGHVDVGVVDALARIAGGTTSAAR